jgi:transcriptional regulator GlxA family with amidase domain
MTSSNRVRTVAILVFDDVEVLDFCGPFEVFAVTGQKDIPAPFRVVTVAEKPTPVMARNGLRVIPHYLLADCPQAELLVVPGGQGTRREMHNATLLAWIADRAAVAELTLSVCTGALLLANAGLLDGLTATTHHGAIELLRQSAPRTTVDPHRRVVDNGRIILSAGVAAGIDMSLYVVARLLGRAKAKETARYIEYPWPREENVECRSLG